jgi:hypothetical protein
MGMLSGVGTALIAVVTGMSGWFLIPVSLGLDMFALCVGKAWVRAEDTVMLTRAEAAVAAEAVLIDPIPGFTLERDPAWKDAEAALDKAAHQVRECGNAMIALAFRKPRMAQWIARVTRGQAETVTMQLNRLTELRLQLAPIIARSGTSPDDLTLELRTVTGILADVLGQAQLNIDLQGMTKPWELNRSFTGVTDCQRGHLGTHGLEGIVTGRDGKRRIARSCRYCSSRWSELV